MQLDKDRVLPIVKAALKEDIGRIDVTTSAVVDKFKSIKASITAKEDCVVSGIQIAEWILAELDYSVRFKPNLEDGDTVGAGKELAFIEGNAQAILRAERTMLNFLSILSGIATRTKKYVDKAKPHGVKILDTRKTIPLFRYLEKYAVFCGGGTNHRMGLYDMVLIKYNQIFLNKGEYDAAKLIEIARKKAPKGLKIEVEVESVAEFSSVLVSRPDIVMLDNMSVKDVLACLEIRRISKFKPEVEVSGGITLETVESYAKTGVDMISVGSITNSVDAIDMSLDII